MLKRNSTNQLLRCDFHCHSKHSDGVRSPAAVAAAMKASGVAMFALTDHDTVSGVHEAQTAARQQGICCLGGIELTIQWKQGTFHLLGLGLKNLQAMAEPLVQIQQCRKKRNDDIMEKLRKHGVDIDWGRLQQYSGKKEQEILNRSHMATYLVNQGYSKSYREAFQRYLAVGALAYVGIEGPSPEEGIKWLHAAGGWALLAHPYSLNLNWQHFKHYVNIWHRAGLDGLEISHPRTSQKDSNRLLKLAQLYGMQYSGGSDYHRGNTMGVLGLGTARNPIDLSPTTAYMTDSL